MRYLGRIISKTKIEGVSEFIEVTQDTSSVVDGGCAKVPTLVVGFSLVKELFGKETMATKKKLGDNLYWTFSKRERRIEYDSDISCFLKTVADFADRYNKYEYLDLMTSTSSDIGEFFLSICERCKKIVYKTKEMLYVYIPYKKKTIGLSLMTAEYMGYTADDIVSHFTTESYFVPENFSSRNSLFDNEPRKTPFLWYLKSF